MSSLPAENAERIEEVIKKILIADAYLDLDIEAIEAEDSLATDLGLDSLGFVELRVQCERQFGVKIPDESFNAVGFHSIASVRDLVLDLQNHQNEK
jgi:acyl carrier protein